MRFVLSVHSSSRIIPIERVFEGDGEEYYPSDTHALALEADRITRRVHGYDEVLTTRTSQLASLAVLFGLSLR
ncbi:hypothetical protein CPC08DRAFT_767896 [Agrocybe pediades]|nr:hypothetical protein CPC08DRAFT_767896 [Agrocybe pediades]